MVVGDDGLKPLDYRSDPIRTHLGDPRHVMLLLSDRYIHMVLAAYDAKSFADTLLLIMRTEMAP